jgi:hypothetical protein
MKPRQSRARSIAALAFSLGVMGWLLASMAAAQAPKFFIKPVAEKKIKELPAGPLYWRLENFPTLAQAQAAAGPTALAAEVSGKVWLFTLGAKGGATPGASEVVEIGPSHLGKVYDAGRNRIFYTQRAERKPYARSGGADQLTPRNRPDGRTSTTASVQPPSSNPGRSQPGWARRAS